MHCSFSLQLRRHPFNSNDRVHQPQKVSLPEEIEARNKELKRYCNLRIECYLLMGKAISEETVKYQPEIERINKEIQYLIASLEK